MAYSYKSDRAKEGYKRRTTRWRQRHPEHWKVISKQIHKRYWDKHKDDIRKKRWLKRFGINAEVYDALFVSQNGVCAICKKTSEEACAREKFLPIDHDHKTKKVRGLLCSLCNRGLGHFKDNPELLDKAASYLRRNSS